jgi:hypothetical protein
VYVVRVHQDPLEPMDDGHRETHASRDGGRLDDDLGPDKCGFDMPVLAGNMMTPGLMTAGLPP